MGQSGMCTKTAGVIGNWGAVGAISYVYGNSRCVRVYSMGKKIIYV
jgi:hypothetical protein